MTGRAEVVGAGLAGLSAAAALARRGWKVTVHERSPVLREIGAGLFLKENGLRTLEDVGVMEDVATSGVRLEGLIIRDVPSGGILERRTERARVMTVLRTELHRFLANAAVMAGAAIRTGSEGLAASPEGELVLASGEKIRADLIVAADGVHSALRNHLNLTKRFTLLPEGATRLVVPRTDDERRPVDVEYWSGRHRVLIVPASENDTYVALMGPEDDARARALPVDAGYWQGLFPRLEALFARVRKASGVHHQNVLVRTHRWAKGRVAVIGDAAHAQPPNLGQGAGMSLANALALARELEGEADIGRALEAWEARWRPVSDAVQTWSYWYGAVAYGWPQALERQRLGALKAIYAFGPTGRRIDFLWQGGQPTGSPS